MGTINGVSNHQPHDCLLNRLFRRRSKKTSKLRVTGLCEENSPVTSEFPTHRASYAENVSIWWHHHAPGGAIEYGWGRVKTKKHWHRDYNKDMTKYVHIWVMSNELGISLQQSLGLCVKCFYRLKTKKPSKICITGQVTGGFSTQNTSNAEYVSLSWCHHKFSVMSDDALKSLYATTQVNNDDKISVANKYMNWGTECGHPE